MNSTEKRIRLKYRYGNTPYIYDVYEEFETRVNNTMENYEGLKRGECRFDYISWGNRLGITHKRMITAIKILSIEECVIKQVFQGKKGQTSIYFLKRFQEQEKANNIKDLEDDKEQNKGMCFEEQNFEQNEEKQEEQKKEQNKLGIINTSSDVEEQKNEQNEEQKIEQKKDQSSKYNNLNIKSNNIYIDEFEIVWRLYPRKEGKAQARKGFIKLRKQYSLEEFTRSIKRYTDSVQGRDKQFIKYGSTFFNGGYEDFLDNNYEEIKDNSTDIKSFRGKVKEAPPEIKDW